MLCDGLFATLDIYDDYAGHSAAVNMAIDEALLNLATTPSIRFYHWPSPALSFGYFVKFTAVAGWQRERELVRRWTGGGIVFHGNDLTYAMVIPANDPLFGKSASWIYEQVHRALVNALAETGRRAAVTPGDAAHAAPAKIFRMPFRRANSGQTASHCFAQPVNTDVTMNGRKIAGAAQRRTRRGLLQQGSIQGLEIDDGLADRFARALSANCEKRRPNDKLLNVARALARDKYGAASWLRRW